MKFDLKTVITIVMIVFSIGGSYTVIGVKAAEVDKLKDKTEAMANKVLTVEVNLENIKESQQEIKQDLKEIIKALKNV